MEINQDHPTFGKYSNMPQRYGWAPGNYSNKCYKCGETFQCDKLAIECADCAYKDEEENVRSNITKELWKIYEK